jgi:transposase-like protein
MSTINTQFSEDRDLVAECMTNHYRKAQRGNHRMQLRVEQFSSITLVECEHKGKLHRDWFHEGAPVITYWLTRDERIDIVKQFFVEGYTQSKIAIMLGFSASTIGKDVRYLRDNGELPEEGNPFRVTPVLMNNRFRAGKLELVSNTHVNSEALHHQQLDRVARTMARQSS